MYFFLNWMILMNLSWFHNEFLGYMRLEECSSKIPNYPPMKFDPNQWGERVTYGWELGLGLGETDKNLEIKIIN